MRIRCTDCSWQQMVKTYSKELARWLLLVHHYYRHGGRKPTVITDGDIMTDDGEKPVGITTRFLSLARPKPSAITSSILTASSRAR